MAPELRNFKYHIFICTNERPAGHPRGSCKEKGSEALVTAFKAALKNSNLASVSRAQKAGCLDACEYGPSVVIYPENVWYGKVQVSDIDEIIRSHLVGGNPVKRLLIPGK